MALDSMNNLENGLQMMVIRIIVIMENRYIVGDLVRENIGDSIVQIINTSRYGYNFINLNNDVNGILVEENIKGIPLTPEILEKNGWKDNGVSYDFSYKDKLYLLNTEYDKKGNITNTEVHNNISIDSYDIFQDSFYLKTIKYVHELQHLLFGIGIDYEIKVC